jgi:cell division protein FtsB
MNLRISETLNYRVLLLIVVFLNACVSSHQMDQGSSANARAQDHRASQAYHEKLESLKDDLAALNQQANILEAQLVAETAITYSDQLAEEYQLVRPAVLHNVLIRVGLKDRGLCYHWTEDLLKQLQSLDLRTYQFHWGVAHRGSELREHNSVVITARGQAFEKGMVLDPWRNSGDLYWALIKSDRYPWQELPPSEW